MSELDVPHNKFKFMYVKTASIKSKCYFPNICSRLASLRALSKEAIT